MPRLLETFGTYLTRGLLAVFTAVVLLLAQSIFWTGAVSLWMRGIVVAVALIAYFRPQHALVLLAAIAPLGQVGSRTLDSQMRGAEALALAFLAGALVRGWTLREFRSRPSTRLETVAMIFGLIVAASCAEQLWLRYAQTHEAWPFVRSVLAYAHSSYLTTFRGLGTIFNAMLLVEGVALMGYALAYARASPAFTRRIAIALVIGAVATTFLTFQHVVTALLQTGDASAWWFEFIVQRRWSAHLSDVNAAGSFFVMALFIAIGLAVTRRRPAAGWSAAAIALAAATWMTHSRTSFVAVGILACCLAAALTAGRAIGVRRAIAAAAVASTGVAAALWFTLPRDYFGVDAADAVTIRWLFLGTTWRMLLAHPVFGVGVGQYSLWSTQFSAPEMFNYYLRENAHNNFAQIAGELGLTGAAAFVGVLVLALRRRHAQDSPAETSSLSLRLGLAAFILTWLGGHPLLVPDVAYPFWIALGAASAASGFDRSARVSAGAIAVTFILLIVTAPFRV